MHFTHNFSRNQRVEYAFTPSVSHSSTKGVFGLSVRSDVTVDGVWA